MQQYTQEHQLVLTTFKLALPPWPQFAATPVTPMTLRVDTCTASCHCTVEKRAHLHQSRTQLYCCTCTSAASAIVGRSELTASTASSGMSLRAEPGPCCKHGSGCCARTKKCYSNRLWITAHILTLAVTAGRDMQHCVAGISHAKL